MNIQLFYPKFKVFDSNGNPLAGGKVYTYEAGTTTPKATYSDKELTVANANPVVLDSNGEAVIYLDGTYKIDIKDSDDSQITGWPQDNIKAASEYIEVSDFAKTFLDDADAAAVRTTIEAAASTDIEFPRAYLAGLQLFNDTDTDHDIGINVGECRDESNTYDLKLDSILTKQIDATWAAGDDAGGLFSGSVAVDTWYHVFLIRKDSDGTIDAGFDTSLTAANIPAGYTAYRRIGSVHTDSSANIDPFTQIGDTFLWNDPITDVSELNVDQSSGALKTLSVPYGLKTKAIINVHSLRDGKDDHLYISSPDVDDEAPSISAAPLVSFPTPTDQSPYYTGGKLEVYTDEDSRIRVRGIDTSVPTFIIATLGYIDRRGRDD